MRKTPSYLKGLAETRARVAADVLRYQQLHHEIGEALEKAKTELTACDMLIRKYDERLNPDLIEPIKAWKGRYGKRGELKEAILETLKARAPDFVTMAEIVCEEDGKRVIELWPLMFGNITYVLQQAAMGQPR